MTKVVNFPGKLYETINYPGGEMQVRIRPENIPLLMGNIRIDARVRSAKDIIELLLLADAIQGLTKYQRITLALPYMPYARADRRFVDGDCEGFMTFYRILCSGPFVEILTLDTHSYSSEIWVHNVEPTELVKSAARNFGDQYPGKGAMLLFPDQGAEKRYSGLYEGIWQASATKKRDAATGRLSGFEVPGPEIFEDHPILIVDDICDGGGTFVGIAEALRAKGIKNPLGLYVTHGIFSKGLMELERYFKNIYTTNSVGEIHLSTGVVYDAFEVLAEAYHA